MPPSSPFPDARFPAPKAAPPSIFQMRASGSLPASTCPRGSSHTAESRTDARADWSSRQRRGVASLEGFPSKEGGWDGTGRDGTGTALPVNDRCDAPYRGGGGFRTVLGLPRARDARKYRRTSPVNHDRRTSTERGRASDQRWVANQKLGPTSPRVTRGGWLVGRGEPKATHALTLRNP